MEGAQDDGADGRGAAHYGFFIGGFSADFLECLFDCVSFFPCVFERHSICG